MSAFNYAFYMGQIKRQNARVYEQVKDLTTKEEYVTAIHSFVMEEVSPPDTLHRPDLAPPKDKTKNSFSQNIVRVYSSLPDIEVPTLKIGDQILPITGKGCKSVKALLYSSISANGKLVESVAEILPVILQNLATQTPLTKELKYSELSYYQKEAVKALRFLQNSDNSVESFTEEDIEAALDKIIDVE